MLQRKSTHTIARLARDLLGYKQLRPGQAEAIQAVLAGQDTLAVLPTGLGKSAIYQLAGVQRAGPTLIVSPLLALQRDQLEAIDEQGIETAAVVNSTLSPSAREQTFAATINQQIGFLFVTPEQLTQPEVLTRLQAAQPSLFVVDEAHCISAWGHDFRPAYLQLGPAIQALGHPTILALTATAALPVRTEIVERLGMHNPAIIVRGFDRPNIWLGVERFVDEQTKQHALLAAIMTAEKPGIVYTATRKRAEELATLLQQRSINAVHYHAGLSKRERDAVHTRFMEDTPADSADVIVATTAFGMGVDKPNVHFVFHYDISDALDSYYQEIGRSGRDGTPARAILWYCPDDLGIRRFFASGGQLTAAEIMQVAATVWQQTAPISLKDLRAELDLSQTRLMIALTRLAAAGAVQMLPSSTFAPGNERHLANIVTTVTAYQERQQQFEQSRLEMMRNYAETRDCRRGFILNYFGEPFDPPCSYCDNCDAGTTLARTAQPEPFPINSTVRHTTWGEGIVMRYEGDKIVVLFNQVGYKTLSLEIVTAQRLLQPAT